VIVVLTACGREIREFPEEIRGDLADALARLDAGETLSMPLSRPMPSMGPGAHELRLKDRTGAYRVIYAIVAAGNIYVVHGFKKTTRATPKRNIEIAMRRIKEVGK
jgi:phage-related protein